MTVSDLTNQIMIPESGMVGRHQNKGFRLLRLFFSLRPHSARFAHRFYFHLAPLGSQFTGYGGKGGTHGYPSFWFFIFLFPCPLTYPAFLSNFFCTISSTKCLTQICKMFWTCSLLPTWMLAKNHTSVLTLPLDWVLPFPSCPFPVLHCMYTGQNLIQVKFFTQGWFSISFELGLGDNGNWEST